MTEAFIVAAVVALAGLWVLRGLLFRPRRAVPSSACGSGCAGCPSACPPRAAGATGRGRTAGRTATALLLAAAAGLAPGAARAVDTIEIFTPGTADFELYLGVDRLARPQQEQRVYSDLVLGYGVSDTLSAYLMATLQANGHLADGSPQLRWGVLSTVVDSPVFDLDLMLEIGTGGAGMSELEILPMVELNLDFGSRAGPWGLYLRTAVPLAGQAQSYFDSVSYATHYHFRLAPGAYWTFADGHQILVEYAAAMNPAPAPGEKVLEHGGVALGYNVTLSPALELVTQLAAGPHEVRGVSAYAMVGFIATVPGTPPAGKP